MRVTNSMSSANVLTNISRSSQKLYELQNQLSSGKKISKPSDNPTNINRLMGFTEDINRREQYSNNIDTMLVNLNTTDGILFTLTEQVNNVEVTLNQYANSALTSGNGDVLASDVENIFEGIMDLANSSLNGRYIFGGYNVANPPFEVVGDRVKYNGTDDLIMVDVGDNESLPVSISGIELFSIHRMEGTKYMSSAEQSIYPAPESDQIRITVGDQTTDITIGHNAILGMTLQDVADSINNAGAGANAVIEKTSTGSRLKLISEYVGSDGEIVVEDMAPGGVFHKLGLLDEANEFVGIQNDPSGGVLSTVLSIKNKMQAGEYDLDEEVNALETGRNGVIKAHAQVGIFTQSLEQRKSFLIDLIIQQKSLRSDTEDIDYAEVMTEYNAEMMAYQAAIKVGADIIRPTLLDYL